MSFTRVLPRIILLVALALAGFLIHRQRETARLNNEAVTLMNQERYDEALTTLREALERDPENEMIQRNIEKVRKALQERKDP